jgi:hypothetical protein
VMAVANTLIYFKKNIKERNSGENLTQLTYWLPQSRPY